MTKIVEDKLEKIPIVNHIARFFKKIKLPGFEGFSIYDLLELYTIGIIEGALTTRASAVAFSFFTAIFPSLLFIIIIIPFIPFEGFQEQFLVFLETFLPPQTSEFFVHNIFENITTTKQGSLLSTVFLLSIFLMANGVNAAFSGFENSFHVEKVRNVFRQYLYALGVAIILAFLVIVTVGVLGYFQIYIVTPVYENWSGKDIDDSSTGLFWLNMAKYLFSAVMTYLAVATLYYFGTREGKHSKFFSVGALFTTLLIILTSFLFGIYIENFSQYNELYGSIGGLLILLFYLWLNSIILLLGFELNASLNQLKRQV